MQPSPAVPLGNPGFEATDSDQCGPNYLVHLTQTYNSCTTLLYDLAVSGASIDNDVVEGFFSVTDLLHQVNESFAGNYASQHGALWNAENTIFNIWMGDNDVYRGYNLTIDYDTLVSELMFQYWDVAVADLYVLEARKFFIVSVPAQERSPRVTIAGPEGDVAKYNELKWKYNEALVANMEAFQAQHSSDVSIEHGMPPSSQAATGSDRFQVKMAFFNSSAWLNTILDEPTTYGFNSDVHCFTPDPDIPELQDFAHPPPDCIWNDDFHLVPEAHNLMARAMVEPMQTLGY